jgi:hypothetical protein
MPDNDPLDQCAGAQKTLSFSLRNLTDLTVGHGTHVAVRSVKIQCI